MKTTAYKWLAESKGRDRTLAEEEFILDVTESIWNLLEESQCSRTDLARKLETSKSNITQLLNGNRNMTLRTLAGIAYVLDTTVRVEFGDDEQAGCWHDVADAIVLKGSEQQRRNVSTREFSLEYQTGCANADWTEISYRKSA